MPWVESWVGLHDLHGSLPTQRMYSIVLWFWTSTSQKVFLKKRHAPPSTKNTIVQPRNQTSKLKHATLLIYLKTALKIKRKLEQSVIFYFINDISSFIWTKGGFPSTALQSYLQATTTYQLLFGFQHNACTHYIMQLSPTSYTLTSKIRYIVPTGVWLFPLKFSNCLL